MNMLKKIKYKCLGCLTDECCLFVWSLGFLPDRLKTKFVLHYLNKKNTCTNTGKTYPFMIC